MAKPILTDAQIKRRKKLQANISITGGTLGLTALGLRGGALARSGGRVGRLLKVAPNEAKAAKLKDASTAVTTTGAGLGGVGAFNFASYTKAESRKRAPQAPVPTARSRKTPVRKDFNMMDFGLGDVHQGQNLELVEKAMKIPTLGFAKPKVTPPTMPSFGQAGSPAQKVGMKTPFNNPSVKTPVQMANPANRAQAKANNGMRTTQKASLTPLGKVTAGGLGAGGVGAAATNMMQRHQQKKQGVSKGFLSTRKITGAAKELRHASDSQAFHRAMGVHYGVEADTARRAGSAYSPKARSFEHDAGAHSGRSAAYRGEANKAEERVATGAKNLRRNALGVGILGGAAGGASGTAYVMSRKKNVKKNAAEIAKAYDPERNRQKRLDRYSTGLQTAAGATGAGAAYHLAGATSLARKGRAAEKGSRHVKAIEANTGKQIMGGSHPSPAKALGYYKSAGKAGGKGLALGAVAAGAVVGADRVKRYKKGRGASYGTLRLTDR